MSEAATEKTSGASGGGGGGNKLVMIVSIVNLVATFGIVGALVVSFNKDAKKAQVSDIDAHGGEHAAEGGEHGAAAGGEHGEAKGAGAKKVAADFGKMIALDQFTVNLSTPGASNPKFVRVNMALQVPGADAETEVGQKMPQIRNAVIDLINSKRPGDLSTAEGRDYLKEEIRNALNSFMVSGRVTGVFFTNFAVSS